MGEAAQIYAALFKLAAESREAEFVKKAAAPVPGPASNLMKLLRNPKVAWGVGATGLGAAGLGIPLAYETGERIAEEEGKMVRNLAFGGGLLSGLVAPTVLKGLGQLIGVTPSSSSHGLTPGAPTGMPAGMGY